ncbi:hypothetical protein CAEBREN_32712 [Caenorhabditis brenneri]|uniref:Uncharacterized protein n=1 Tax=Caenorhabditis brenneri TaxID=135651 RepID=G0PM43_CAEBE|nr:hypothetical protein CAEBREN_32712 [Caenorhabditis brenneri]
MPSEEWIRGEAVTQSTCGYISILINCLLMFLIRFKSPPKLGNYKWLMLYTCFFELIYAFMTLFAGPHVHTFGSAFIVFQDMNKYIYSHQVGKLLIWIYCSCFGFSVAMFAGHFIYRYSTIDLDFRRKYLSGYKQLFPFFLPLFCSLIWGSLCYFCYDETPQRSTYLRPTMCAYFWPLDGFGSRYADFRSFLGVGIMQTVVGLSLGSVLYFDSSKSLHNQLLHSLVIQTLIPLVLMYLPAAIVFVFPMLSIDLNTKYPIITHAVALYPALDPLPTILIIKSYRKCCIQLVRILTCRGEFHVKGYLNRRSNTINPVSFTASN